MRDTARQIIRINDPHDPRIAEFRDIRERDLVGRHGQFIAEGTVVLRMLAAAHVSAKARFRAEKLLLLENRLEGLGEILAAFPAEVRSMSPPLRFSIRSQAFTFTAAFWRSVPVCWSRVRTRF